MEACSKKTCTQNALFSNMPQMGQTFVSVSFNCPLKAAESGETLRRTGAPHAGLVGQLSSTFAAA